ncbi:MULTISPECIES: IS110 family transposase [unclassified Legionella]|uniref:IS110 family transposase n=1 Tax=unclassified Legionella TaxID=2622702 RepID=UPI001E29BF67|nr:IS110 family transposase [Legionella sp. 31fI33]MCC5015793.1 IS110 family transposase [Legionella sp. 31fI33]
MEVYKNYIGIDIGKLTFVTAEYGSNKVIEYDNAPSGIEAFLKDYKNKFKNGLCILETTGGYEMRLLLTLCETGVAVHRANTRKVKRFIQSYGNEAKTDKLDAKSLALYGYERANRLSLFSPVSAQALALFELVQRRNDLKQMLIAEKNRFKAPRAAVIKTSCQSMIEVLNNQLCEVTAQINILIAQDTALKAKKAVLKTIPGIGDIIANELLVLLPELGTLTRRKIASLAGLAPKANDSGQFSGYRAVNHGRSGIKPNLFLAAMAARNSNSSLKIFYNNLVAAGKKKMVALTALMRKIIVIANAKIRDFNLGLVLP